MPRFAANLTMMFTEWPFLDRFAAAAEAGFEAVEFLFPYEHAPEEIAARLERNGLRSSTSTCRRATGRPASAAWRRCRGARPSSRQASRRRWPMPAPPACRASMPWPG